MADRTSDERLALCEERIRYLVRDVADLERDVTQVKRDVATLGTAAQVAAAVADNASRRERRLYALAGLALTAVNVAIAVLGVTVH